MLNVFLGFVGQKRGARRCFFLRPTAVFDDGLTPGVEIIESGKPYGNIRKDGSFILAKSSTAKFDGLNGQATLNIDFDGAFSPVGWSGNFEMISIVAQASLSCTYKATFTEDKIISTTCAKAQPNVAPEWYGTDYVSAIGDRAGVAVSH